MQHFLIAIVLLGVSGSLALPAGSSITASPDWPVQTRAQSGYSSPQDPSTLPGSAQSSLPNASLLPHSKPIGYAGPVLAPKSPNSWTIAGGWKLIAAPNANAAAEQISSPQFATQNWYDATVPGTVLTTLIDRGVYPDPDYGLNNLSIPETLNKQSYWYRTEFIPPATVAGKRLSLTFHGINYSAAVWLNGQLLGSVKGAFIRGVFEVTKQLNPGQLNALAIQISPPPHPGIPQEQSVKGGPGENGGALCLDGPTFVATEGWDWIPGIRDRNIGLWQEVTLTATGLVKIGDTQVLTHLPLPDTSHASITVTVPLRNDTGEAVSGVLHADFEGVSIQKPVTATPGESLVSLAAAEFPRLSVDHPRLWWPNGYGKPELYHLTVSFATAAGDSDIKTVRFGIREITYELSLANPQGDIRRVEYSPAAGPGRPILDVSHRGIIKTPQGWIYSLRPEADSLPGIRALDDLRVSPYLVIRVNGVRIACKGGNWGMDDSRKRVSREHLEPFFRLHRDANLNIIRNWCGQSTEEVFYDLADEYGLLVWNDFWESTQNYNVEPSDTALFLGNAKDTVLRFRNHPSIAVWCGRNEGVPAPAVNQGLDELLRTLDGTRLYAPSSNVINLQNSGPYKYQQPVDFFTKFARGFAVELGIPSMPTIESFRSFVPIADQWPPNDTWAYHDWHQSGNGDVAPFMASLDRELGAAANLEDFERKAQLLNYVAHRAIFEGFNAHLWNPNSGRMLWMTQPAWPSTVWQILSSDYDTQASFYGVKKGSEPIHVQLNLPDLKAAVVNNTSAPLHGLVLRATVFNVGAESLYSHEEIIDAPQLAETDGFSIAQNASAGLVFVKLELLDSQRAPLSENFYWYSGEESGYRLLNNLPEAALNLSAAQTTEDSATLIRVQLENPSKTFALMTKLTLRKPDGTRILPAYYSDNYVSLLPGEKRQIQVELPAGSSAQQVFASLSGWNVKPALVPVAR